MVKFKKCGRVRYRLPNRCVLIKHNHGGFCLEETVKEGGCWGGIIDPSATRLEAVDVFNIMNGKFRHLQLFTHSLDYEKMRDIYIPLKVIDFKYSIEKEKQNVK